MHTDLPQRPKLETRIKIAISPEDKRRLFETAAARRVTVSELIRAAVAQMTYQAA